MFLSVIADKNFADYVINFFTNFLGTPALLIGLASLIGCLLQRKKVSETITSVFKTIIGFLIIGGGAALISTSIGKFGAAFTLLFNRKGFIANNDVMPGLFLGIEDLAWIATAGSLILIFAMLFNLVLAKISHLKYIYLTGHVAWYFSTMVASVLHISGLNQQADMPMIIFIGAMLVSMWMVISPAILNRHMKIITKSDNLALTHTGSLTYALSGYIGEAVYKISKGKVHSTEDIKFPKGLSFLRNTNVSIALTMLILYLTVYYIAWAVRGEEAMAVAGIISTNGTQSIFVQGLIGAFTFAAGVEVILIGVRMFVAEITPAFKGIADKLVKSAKPGIDCPVVFPFAPNAVLLGFIGSTCGGFLAFAMNIGISSALGSDIPWAAIIIPSIIPHFFTGATAGVFGNAKGGILGCLIGAFVNGFLISLVPLFFVGFQLVQPQILAEGMLWGDADFILGLIPAFILKWTNQWVLMSLTILAWLLIPGCGWLIHYYKMKKSSEYKTQYLAIKELNKQFSQTNKIERKTYKAEIKTLMLATSDKKEFKQLKQNKLNDFEKSLKSKNRAYEKEVAAVKQAPRKEEEVK